MSNDNLPMMHSTYFTLPMGSTPANRDSYMAACAAYLSHSPGMNSFWIAQLAQDIFRPVSDRDFNVSMNQMFENKAAFDHYNGEDPDHEQFVVEVNRWSPGTGRRVYDSYVRHQVNKECKIPSCDESPRMIHNLYFSLTNTDPESIDKFIEVCIKYLSDHDGLCNFAIGTLANLGRDVSITNYDVAMNMLWQDKAAYSTYEKSAMHKEFFIASAGMVSNTQVFDAYISEIP